MKRFPATIKPPKEEEDSLYSRYVIVSNGTSVGYGFYDFDNELWYYNMPGCEEASNNFIIEWMDLPDFNKEYIGFYNIHDLIEDVNALKEKLIIRSRSLAAKLMERGIDFSRLNEFSISVNISDLSEEDISFTIKAMDGNKNKDYEKVY